MGDQKGFLNLIIGLAAIGIVVWLVFNAVTFIVIGFTTIKTELATAILAASAIIITSAITTIFGKLLEKKYEAELHDREKKITTYEEFMKMLVKTSSNKVPITEEQNPFTAEFNRELILWCAPSVIKGYAEYKKVSQTATQREIILEKIMYDIRKDLGNSNRGLKTGDMLPLLPKNEAVEDPQKEI
jgi:hypothetical protein